MRILVLLLTVGASLAGQDVQDARMQRGDDKRWADPAFDDHAWPRVRDVVFRSEDAATNRLWLRMRVEIPAEPAVVLASMCSCEFYLNGVRIGATGDLDLPRPAASTRVHSFVVPASIPPGPALLAVRQYHPPGVEAIIPFHFLQAIRVAESRRAVEVAQAISDARTLRSHIRLAIFLLALGSVLAASAGVRRVPELPFILAYLLSHGAIFLAAVYSTASVADLSAVTWSVGATVIPLLVLFQFQLAEVRIPGIWLATGLFTWAVLRLPLLLGLYLAEPASWIPWFVPFAGFPVTTLLGLAISVGLLAYTWRRPGVPRRLLLTAIAIQVLILLPRLSILRTIVGSGFSVAVQYNDSLSNLVFVGLVTGHVVSTSNRRRNEEQRLRGELVAAQSVQSLLLSRPMPEGVDAVYLPASEVGGDFYQVLERADGSRVVLVGDVSGKGLKAAMLVSVAVGILRNEKSSSPAAILGALNNGLAGHTGGGFVTCCCARFDADGTVTIANAGHPSPYCDGREVEVAAGLPLGVMGEVVYEESVVRGERFTFVSDGVVEAENAQRELFGFDRTRAISTKSALEIAEAAKAWGQNDDITVVTVRRNA